MMFEITSDDIARLDDEDLRALIGLLSEAEARSRGLSASFVTWGGNQNAADGGVDVRVAIPEGVGIDGFVPRPMTGFQVKKSDMSRSDILAEMLPNGALRPAIRDLAERSGAYVIVSSGSSTSDASLQNRRAAMKEAVEDLPNGNALTLEFYDRTRVATWLRDHAGLIPWVRAKIGKAIQGWHSYGAWAYAPEGVGAGYLLDEKVRIRTGAQEAGIGLLDGIQSIRERLHQPGKIVRLVGLSGVGKTRLVQALFDDRTGAKSLDPSLAIYTNIADSPDPQPTALASDLVAARTRAIVVVDNCTPELHSRLSDVCRSPESAVSLITVEYDIQEDEPEGTDVFSLEPSSSDLITKLIQRRFPDISTIDGRTIAELSDGNARVAIALAGTVGKNESIASLSDQDLFRRLFHQRNEPDLSLLLAAQALSLVYSYHGEDISSADQAELFRLGALTGKTPQEMFRCSAELQRRELVQKRGVWRAVLPHAIANRLAMTALQNIPSTDIRAQLIQGAPERLLKSFSRRLGYLIGSKEAEAIVREWLGPGGLLENVADLNELGLAMFNYIAPVAPEAALTAVERALLNPRDSETVVKCRRYVHLLRSLAYDAALFERCIALILKIAEAQDIDGEKNEASKAFASLFPIYLSGTHARLDQRLTVVNALVRLDDRKKRALGLMALKAALAASHFGPGYNFEFGSRSRDYGYWPRSKEEVKEWFRQTLSLTEELACSDQPGAPEVRSVLAEQFRGLWSGAQTYDDVARVCGAISKICFWAEGWIAIRQTMYYDSGGCSTEVAARLIALETLLRPRDLVQKVRSIVLSESVLYTGVDCTSDGGNNIEKTMTQAHALARDLGKAVAANPDVFALLLPELLVGTSEQMWSFGGGLAEGAKEPAAIWSQLVIGLSAAPVDKRNPHIFRGFLKGLHATDAELANDLLDDAVEGGMLTQWFPVLQTAVGIDKEGVNRLMRSLELGEAWIGVYRNLVGGGVTHQICGRDFNRLLLRIAGEPGGLDIAIEILCMRLSFDEGRRQSSPSEIIDVGCELMRQLKFVNRRDVGSDYRLGIVARHCLIGEKGAATVREICRNLKESISKFETYAFYHQELLQVLLNAQPYVVLAALCGDGAAELKVGISILDQASQLRRNVFDSGGRPSELVRSTT